jgi:hypothetical protein
MVSPLWIGQGTEFPLLACGLVRDRPACQLDRLKIFKDRWLPRGCPLKPILQRVLRTLYHIHCTMSSH